MCNCAHANVVLLLDVKPFELCYVTCKYESYFRGTFFSFSSLNFPNLNNKNCIFEAGKMDKLDIRVAVRFIFNPRLSYCYTDC